MRARTLLSTALVLASLGAIAVGCSLSNGGSGTAPGESDPCPEFSKIQAGADCNGATSTAPRVCCYVDGALAGETGLCGGGAQTETVAYCQGGADAGWIVQTVGEAGVSDADADAASEAATDAADATDATDATDAADAADATDAADAASEAATDAADAASDSADVLDDAG